MHPALRATAIVLGGALFVAVLASVLRAADGDLPEMIRSAGVWGPLLIVVLQASRPVTWLPGPVLTPLAGYLFGFWNGLLFSWLGGVLAVALGYALPRLVGVHRFRELAERRVPALLAGARKHPVKTVLIARVVPGVPANLVSYAAGVAGYRFPVYFGASIVGILPRLIIQTLIGAGLYALG